MAYGSEAYIPGIGRERFAAFSFDRFLRNGSDVALNVMHEADLIVATRRRGDLTLTDSPEALTMRADLPQGDAFDSVLELVGDGLTGGLSVEFHALQQRRTADMRTITEATLPALGIVDDPAYPASGVEARQRGRGVGGEYRYNMPRVTSDRGRVRKTSFRTGAFKWQLDAFQKAQDDLGVLISEAIEQGIEEARQTYEIQLLRGRSYDAPLASYRMGTLKLEDTDEALRFSVDRLPDTTYVDDMRAAMRSGAADFGIDLLYDLPPAGVIGEEPTAFIPDPTNPDVQIEEVRFGLLRAIAIVSRPPRGNPGAVETRADVTPKPRRRVWL